MIKGKKTKISDLRQIIIVVTDKNYRIFEL